METDLETIQQAIDKGTFFMWVGEDYIEDDKRDHFKLTDIYESYGDDMFVYAEAYAGNPTKVSPYNNKYVLSEYDLEDLVPVSFKITNWKELTT